MAYCASDSPESAADAPGEQRRRCYVKNADASHRVVYRTERRRILQQQDRAVKTTSLNVKAGTVTIVPGSSARLGSGTDMSAAVSFQVSSDSVTRAVVI